MGNPDLLHLAKFTYYDRYIERAAIKEYDAGMDRERAEEEAFKEVLAEFKGDCMEATEEMLKLAVYLRRAG